jgi:hypothetical protein
MIDLTKKSLPNTVRVNGRDFSIYTDYRVWMRFENDVKHMNGLIDIAYLFKNDMPIECDVRELFTFSRPESELPRQTGKSSVNVLDYEIDSDYIYAAFLEQYGIDLVDVEQLHWHKFLALLRGLNGTKLNEIMGYRCYEKDDKPYEEKMNECRFAWEIEPPMTDEEKERLDEFSDLFTREDS